MMRKFSVVFFIFFYVLGFSQSIPLINPTDNSVYPAQQYVCSGEKFNLKVDASKTTTGDYLVSSVTDFTASNPALTVPFTNKTGNDHFSSPVTIPFVFNFYGKDYTKVVVGSNGRLIFGSGTDFDNLNTNRYVDKIHSGNDATSTNLKLPDAAYGQIDSNDYSKVLNFAQIFAGYTDLGYYTTSYYNKITYGTASYKGINGLLISFAQVLEKTVGDGYASTMDMQILLLSDNKILIKVRKPNATKNALIGIQNESASKARWPINSEATSVYNNGKWSSDFTSSWLFTPNQNLTPQFKWFQNSTVLSETTNTLSNFTPNDGDVLKVEVTYVEDPSKLETGEILFKKIPKPVINYNSSAACVSGVTMNVSTDPDLNFEWYRVGNTTSLGTGNSYYATQNGSYFVRAIRKISPLCYVDSDPVTINLNSTIPPFNQANYPLNFCDTSGTTSKIINLYNYYPADPLKYTLRFIDGVTTVPDPANFEVFANTVRTVGIYVNDPVSGCTINMNFNIRFDSMPATITNLPKKFCFGETSIDVTQYQKDLAGAGFANFDYQYSTDGVNFSSNSIFNPKTSPKIWVKILPKNQPTSTCFTISTIIFNENPKVIANTPNPNNPDFQQCASSTQYFELTNLFNEINPDPNVTITFHNNLSDAETGSRAVAYQFRGGLGTTTLYIRVVDNLTGCVSPDHPSIKLLVYYKPKLNQNSINKVNCAGNNFFDLTQNLSSLVTLPSGVIAKFEYFDPSGNQLTGSQITNYNSAISGQNPYVKLTYNPTCGDIIPFNLTFNPKPAATVSQILICEETTYPLQNFKDKVISNSANYTFSDASGNPLPANFNLSILPHPVKFLMKDNTTGCVSDIQTVTFVKGGNSVLLKTETDYVLCDDGFDGKTNFNLDSKKSDFTSDRNAMFDYFKDAALTQSISANYTNEIPFNQTVYAKITIPGFCAGIAEIHLKVNTPTKSTTLLDKYFICYGEELLINAGDENDKWEWSTGETSQTIKIKTPGNYSVKLTNTTTQCFYTHNFIVSDENQPKIEVINQSANSIEVIANGGEKPYKYHFNGIVQNSNILNNPTESSYTIQVESATGCLGVPKSVYFIKINNAFTPNADGINDTWSIQNLDKMEKVSLIIVDRYGTKVFESQNTQNLVWDGKYSGRALPTSTYWYTVSWFDPVTQKAEQRQGWILLKNRD